MQPLTHIRQLIAMHDSANFKIIDARAGADAYERFLAGHLFGANFVHLENDLSDIKPDLSNGGRHPLPSPSTFSVFLGTLGITPQTHVVVYDDRSGAFAAARFWWMLKAAGHQKVQVLNGGIQAAIGAGFPIERGIVTGQTAKGSYGFSEWLLPIAGMQQVKEVSEQTNWLLIDVRETERYRGETEPYDPVAGHIPGAINIPYTQNLDAIGLYLSPEKLRSMYQKIIGNRPASQVIVHCGSGVTACHTLLAMAHAGLEIAALYTGSFSEWCRNGNRINGSM